MPMKNGTMPASRNGLNNGMLIATTVKISPIVSATSGIAGCTRPALIMSPRASRAKVRHHETLCFHTGGPMTSPLLVDVRAEPVEDDLLPLALALRVGLDADDDPLAVLLDRDGVAVGELEHGAGDRPAAGAALAHEHRHLRGVVVTGWLGQLLGDGPDGLAIGAACALPHHPRQQPARHRDDHRQRPQHDVEGRVRREHVDGEQEPQHHRDRARRS